MEIWKPIKETKGLVEVSNEGNVRSLLRGYPFELKTQEDQKGYRRVSVTVEREKRTFKVHREVARAFIPNPNNLPQVNHKDGNKCNNSVENLEWVTNKENINHAIEHGMWETVRAGVERENDNRKRPVIGTFYGGDCTSRRSFESVSEAERFLDSRHISDVLKGKRKKVKGWTFEYVEEVMPYVAEHQHTRA